MNQASVLILHQNPSTIGLLGSMLQSLGFQIEEAANDRIAVRRLERGGVDLLIAGIQPLDPEGLEIVSYTKRKHPKVPILVLFPAVNAEKARDAIRMGAINVLKFPMPANELRAAVTQACEGSTRSDGSNLPGSNLGQSSNGSSRRLDDLRLSPSGLPRPGLSGNGKPSDPAMRRSDGLSHQNASGYGSSNGQSFSNGAGVVNGQGTAIPFLGDEASFRLATELAATVAPTRSIILIVGEQGTGKTLMARRIHQLSGRGTAPFVEVSCAGIDDLGLERELFGQKIEGENPLERPGRIQRADGGTVLLDEVAALSLPIQDRLIQVLKSGQVEPIGSTESIAVDVRFLFSTRENLSTLVEQGKFRRELHERITDICLKLPPLRQRLEDILPLAEYFREKAGKEFNKATAGFSPDALDLLNRHEWPGNVRELESVIQRGVALCQASKINSANLAVGIAPTRSIRPPAFSPRAQIHPSAGIRPLKEALEEPEKQIIVQALRALNWNRQETARVLDINRTTLYKKMKKYGLLIEEPALLN